MSAFSMKTPNSADEPNSIIKMPSPLVDVISIDRACCILAQIIVNFDSANQKTVMDEINELKEDIYLDRFFKKCDTLDVTNTMNPISQNVINMKEILMTVFMGIIEDSMINISKNNGDNNKNIMNGGMNPKQFAQILYTMCSLTLGLVLLAIFMNNVNNTNNKLKKEAEIIVMQELRKFINNVPKSDESTNDSTGYINLLINTVNSFITHPDKVLERPLLLQDFTWFNEQDSKTKSTVAPFVQNAINDANQHIKEPTQLQIDEPRQLRISDRAHVDESTQLRISDRAHVDETKQNFIVAKSKELKRFWRDDPEVYLSIIVKNAKLRLIDNIYNKFSADCFNKITNEKSAANLLNLLDNFVRPWSGNTKDCIKADFFMQERLAQKIAETTINESAYNIFLLYVAIPLIASGAATVFLAFKGCMGRNKEKKLKGGFTKRKKNKKQMKKQTKKKTNRRKKQNKKLT
jgi:hypothetical protein